MASPGLSKDRRISTGSAAESCTAFKCRDFVVLVIFAMIVFGLMPASAAAVPSESSHTSSARVSHAAQVYNYDGSEPGPSLFDEAERPPLRLPAHSAAAPRQRDSSYVYDAARNAVAPRPVAAGPTVLGGADNRLAEAATWVRPLDGYHDVVVHGTESGFAVLRNGQWVDIDHRTLSTFIQNSPDYAGGPIRLVSCSTGCGVAQDLSNKLGVDILAPTNTAWIHPSGAVTVGPSPYVNSGFFDLFSPGGS